MTEEIVALAQRRMSGDGIPGMTIGFIHGDEVWAAGLGLADLENKVAATKVSAYRYASVQKPMTAVAILQLVEQGMIELGADIRTYVPYFPDKGRRITIRQLLGHLGGIPSYGNSAVEEHFTDQKSTRRSIEVFAGFDLVSEPGSRFLYTSYGYNLLGAAIEGATGLSYADYMRDHVWRASGMKDTRMDDPSAIVPHRVRGYRLVDGQVRNSEFVNVSSRFAAGGARGTVPDLLSFGEALLAGRLLKRESLTLMSTPMTTRDGKFSGFPRTAGYSMGWNVLHDGLNTVLMHDGGQPETRTMLVLHPDERLVIATAQNLEKDLGREALAYDIYECLLRRPFPMRT